MNTKWSDPRLQENFSLVLGGPLYQLYLRSRLLKPPVELVERRVAASIVVTWLPLLIFTLMAGNALGGVKVPFLFDLDVHIRLLLALPLLIGLEVVVHSRMSVAVDQFLVRGIIAPHDRARFDQIIATTMQWRNSAAVEILLGKPPAEERLIGSADIQSLADLANAFEVVRGMRLLPLDRQALLALAVTIALPFAPLALTMFPVDELITGLLTKIF